MSDERTPPPLVHSTIRGICITLDNSDWSCGTDLACDSQAKLFLSRDEAAKLRDLLIHENIGIDKAMASVAQSGIFRSCAAAAISIGQKVCINDESRWEPYKGDDERWPYTARESAGPGELFEIMSSMGPEPEAAAPMLTEGDLIDLKNSLIRIENELDRRIAATERAISSNCLDSADPQ